MGCQVFLAFSSPKGAECGIGADSKDELVARMWAYWALINETPAPTHWKYQIDDLLALTENKSPAEA